MCQVSQEQINCVFQTDADVRIFDQDNWINQEETKQPEGALQNKSNKFIPDKNQNKHDQELIKKIDTELVNSKQNFFKVNILKKQRPKKQGSSNLRSLKRIQSIAQKNPNSILKQSYVDKKTDGFIFKWKTRFMALTSQKLYFFQDGKKQKVIGCVNIKIVSVSIKKNKDQITLDFQGQSQNIVLKLNSVKECEEWVEVLETVLKYQQKQKKLLLKTMIKPLYNNQDSLTEKQFNRIAETGDILLFYTRNTGAKIQRFLTNSDFDHVAMVVKLGKNQAMVFESNQTYGVSIYQWGQYIRFFDLYDKVTIRKLHSARKQQMHHTLLSFVKKNLGKKYDINAMKLLKLQSDFNWDQTKQIEDQSRGYFCSQLVAKCYKSVGLIDQKKYSGRYWPVDFSQKGSIQLKNGAYLGSQQSIILNRHIKNKI